MFGVVTGTAVVAAGVSWLGENSEDVLKKMGMAGPLAKVGNTVRGDIFETMVMSPLMEGIGSAVNGPEVDRIVRETVDEAIEACGNISRITLEKAPFWQTRKSISEFLQKYRPEDRVRPQAEADKGAIDREAALIDDSSSLDIELKTVPSERAGSDRQTLEGLTDLMNQKRGGLPPLTLLPFDHQYSQIAQRKATFINGAVSGQHDNPLDVLLHPPVKRGVTEETRPLAGRDWLDRPQFGLSAEEEARVRGDLDYDTDNPEEYQVAFDENDNDYASRIREAESKRRSLDYEQFSVSLEMDDPNYPHAGDFSKLWAMIEAKPNYLAAVMGGKQVAMGLDRTGDKLTLSVIVLKGPQPQLESAPKTKARPINSMTRWWFEQIPEPDRREGSESWKILHELKKDGNTALEVYNFRKGIESLHHEGFDINMGSLESELISDDEHMLIINVSVNGKQEMVTLESGDKILVPKTSAVFGAAALSADGKGRGVPMLLSDYLGRLKAMTKDGSLKYRRQTVTPPPPSRQQTASEAEAERVAQEEARRAAEEESEREEEEYLLD